MTQGTGTQTQGATPAKAGAPAPPPIPAMERGAPSAASTPQEAQAAAKAAVVNARQAARDAAQQVKDATKQLRDLERTSPVQGNPVVGNPADFRNVVPQGAVDISVAFFVTVAVCIVGFPIARALARAMDRRTERTPVGAGDLGPRMQQLQDSVDAMAIEIERISEAQRFQSKLLADRSKDVEALGR